MIEILDYCFRRRIFRVINCRFESVELLSRPPFRPDSVSSAPAILFTDHPKFNFQIFSVRKYNLFTAAGRMGNS